MSLRYQKQILIEKVEIIIDNKNKIIENSLLHSNDNLSAFYTTIKNYKKKILLIDIAFLK